MRLDWLKVVQASPEAVSTTTYGLINAAQDAPAEVRLLASAVHLKLAAEAAGVTPQDIMTAADNVMASPDGRYRRTEFVAAKSYMENEK